MVYDVKNDIVYHLPVYTVLSLFKLCLIHFAYIWLKKTNVNDALPTISSLVRVTSMLKDELNSKFSPQCMCKTIPEHVFFSLHYSLWALASTQTIQSGPQDQKSVIFSHSVISLNQLQNSINTNIF